MPLCYGFGRQFTTLNTVGTDPKNDKTVALAELIRQSQARLDGKEDIQEPDGEVDLQQEAIDAVFDRIA